MFRTDGWECLFLNANKRVENYSTLEIAIKSYIMELLDLVTHVQADIFVAEHEGWVKKMRKFVKKNLLITCIIRR